MPCVFPERDKVQAQRQAALGVAPWGGMSGEIRPSGRHAGMYATQGFALCYVVLPLQFVCLHPAR